MGIQLISLAPLTLAAAALFTTAWLVLGRISTGFTIFGTCVAPYNGVAQSISGLGLGKTAVAMNAAFVLTAMLLAAGIIGVMAAFPGQSDIERLLVGAILLLSPIGIAACGIFDLEHFMPHLIGFVLAMGAPVLGFLALGWRLSLSAAHADIGHLLVAAAPVTLVLLIAYFWSFDPEASGRGLGYSGLIQRLLTIEVLGVFAFVGWSVSPGAVT